MAERFARVVAATFVALLTGSCTYGTGELTTQTQPPVLAPDDQADGRELYLRHCAWCHGANGQGTDDGPAMADAGAAAVDFVLSTGRMPVGEPDDRMRRSDPLFDRDQIDAITDYAARFGAGPEIPAVAVDGGQLGLGAELYRDDCAACHSSTGAGGALTSGEVAPSLHLASDVEIAEAVVTGPGTMPAFGHYGTIERDSVVAYVAYLRNASSRGGADLGRIGPVSEGFVAWAVGLLALVVVIRLTGTSGRS